MLVISQLEKRLVKILIKKLFFIFKTLEIVRHHFTRIIAIDDELV